MPIYEYECTDCGDEIEIVHGISEKPKRKCPKCGGRMKRLMSLNSFHLKGTGWYKPSAKEAKAEKSDKPSEKGAKAEKADKKTEKKESKKPKTVA